MGATEAVEFVGLAATTDSDWLPPVGMSVTHTTRESFLAAHTHTCATCGVRRTYTKSSLKRLGGVLYSLQEGRCGCAGPPREFLFRIDWLEG